MYHVGVCALAEGKRTREAVMLSIRNIAIAEATIFVFEIFAILFVRDSIRFFSIKFTQNILRLCIYKNIPKFGFKN
jgi:hypothetical protein